MSKHAKPRKRPKAILIAVGALLGAAFLILTVALLGSQSRPEGPQPELAVGETLDTSQIAAGAVTSSLSDAQQEAQREGRRINQMELLKAADSGGFSVTDDDLEDDTPWKARVKYEGQSLTLTFSANGQVVAEP